MSEKKEQFLQMLVELCRAYEVTYHDDCEEVFSCWEPLAKEGVGATVTKCIWDLSGEELEQAINKEAK